MKKTTLLSLVLLLTISSLSFAKKPLDDKSEGIQFFHGTFKEALAKAKKEKKMIFMDAYTTWCGPCKYLKSTVFPDKNLGTYMNEKFVCVAIDWESTEGQTLSQAYVLDAYPTLFFIDANGKTKGTMRGVPQADPAGAIVREAKKYVGK